MVFESNEGQRRLAALWNAPFAFVAEESGRIRCNGSALYSQKRMSRRKRSNRSNDELCGHCWIFLNRALRKRRVNGKSEAKTSAKCSPRNVTILFLGLDGAGKTTLIADLCGSKCKF